MDGRQHTAELGHVPVAVPAPVAASHIENMSLQWVPPTGVAAQFHPAAFTLTVPHLHAGATLECYVSAEVTPQDASSECRTWVSVFCKPTDSAADRPVHACALPFPLNLPLYPSSVVIFLVFDVKAASVAAAVVPAPPFMLGPPPPELDVVAFRDVSVSDVSALLSFIHGSSRFSAPNTTAVLRNAFDGLWTLAPQKDYDAHVCEGDDAGDDSISKVDEDALLVACSGDRRQNPEQALAALQCAASPSLARRCVLPTASRRQARQRKPKAAAAARELDRAASDAALLKVHGAASAGGGESTRTPGTAPSVRAPTRAVANDDDSADDADEDGEEDDVELDDRTGLVQEQDAAITHDDDDEVDSIDRDTEDEEEDDDDDDAEEEEDDDCADAACAD